MSDLRLLLLGPPRLERDGERIRLETRKATALLTYLAVTRQSYSRESLTHLLWPDNEPDKARTALRYTLWTIKKSLGEDLLIVGREDIALAEGANVWVDVTHFKGELAQIEAVGTSSAERIPALREVVALYRDDFLAGFGLPDSPVFDEWQFFETEDLRRTFAGALSQLVNASAEMEDYRSAINYGRRWLTLDPLQESVHRRLMQLYALAGERSAALRQYQVCARLLDEELEVPPEDETRQLYEAIKGRQFLSPEVQKAETPDLILEGKLRSAPHIPLQSTKTGRDAQHILLDKVKSFWVEGVLDQSLHGAAWIETGKEVRTDILAYPWEMVLRRPYQESDLLPADNSIVDVFDESGRALLILGEPGSGKTTMLLDLARATVARAETDPGQPIPVVFNLSSWTDNATNFTEWLVAELNEKYLIPKKIGREWVNDDQLLLLLDGLDEVNQEGQASCLAAINQFRQEHGLAHIAVCSRIADYEALTARLRLESAIVLQPLSEPQILRFLQAGGDRLAGLRTALQEDLTLLEIARSPLMLSIMTLAYQDTLASDLVERDSLATRRHRLFAAYAAQMFQRRGTDPAYLPSQARRWLAWLAQKLTQHDQTIFLVEKLQPSWLPSRGQQWFYFIATRAIGGLLIGLVLALGGSAPFTLFIQEDLPFTLSIIGANGLAGLLAGIAVGIMDAQTTPTKRPLDLTLQRRILETLFLGLLTGLIVVLVLGRFYGNYASGALSGAFSGLVFVLLFRLRNHPRTARTDIQTGEVLTWSWRSAAIAGVGGLIVGEILALISGQTRETESQFDRINEILFLGLFLSLMFAIIGGLRRGLVLMKTVPNQGIRLSARNALVGGLAVWVLTGIGGALITGLLSSLGQLALPGWSVFGAIFLFGGIAALWYGGLDLINHFTLRLMFRHKDRLPWDVVRFLNYATDRLFLRRVGGGYIFVHQLLRDYFLESSYSSSRQR